MKKLILGLCLLSGCAALRGQTKYTGAGDRPTITERIIHYPQTPRPGFSALDKEDTKVENDDKTKDVMRSYWDMPADKIATVANPLDVALKIHVACYASFPSDFDFVVPAHTSQDMLLTTNAQYMYDTLCHIAYYRVAEEKK